VIDTGLPERELRKLVSIGGAVSFDRGLPAGRWRHHRKALDNRA